MAINRHVTINIPSGSSLSEGFQLDTGMIVGILMPDSFSGNQISFDILRPTDSVFIPHFDSLGQQITIVVGPSRSIAMDDEVRALPTRGTMRIRTNQTQAQNAQLICVIKED